MLVKVFAVRMFCDTPTSYGPRQAKKYLQTYAKFDPAHMQSINQAFALHIFCGIQWFY